MLRYTSPATEWNQALPIGNGRLGAMVYGGVHQETIRLNEDSVWYGGPVHRTPNSAAYLPKLRKMIQQHDFAGADELVRQRFLATPQSARHYEPLGTCALDFDYGEPRTLNSGAEPYTRSLKLDTACTVDDFTVNQVRVKREWFASYPANIIVCRISASKSIAVTLHLTRMSDVDWETNEFLDSVEVKQDDDAYFVAMHVTPGGRGSNSTACVVSARCEDSEGTIEVIGRDVRVAGKEMTIFIAAHTTFRSPDPERAAIADIKTALKQSWDELHAAHLADWQSLYNTMALCLTSNHPESEALPTNERLRLYNTDPSLVSLYVSYSRYLLLSSSRMHSDKPLPATLQGIWNPSFQPPWGSKYTININLQMNYWPSHTCNISSCELPLFELIKRMALRGQHTASKMYGCRGWCAHHNTDIWADTDPQDRWMPATLWPMGGAWLCLHIWEHYSFTGNKDLLEDMLPTLEGCAVFLLDFLVPDPSGQYLVTVPSLSPENTFITPAGAKGVFCQGSTIDMYIVRSVFEDYIRTLFELSRYPSPTSVAIESALPRLQPLTVSPVTSTIQEWGLVDHQEFELGHRHVSHLLPLYPGSSITPTSTPALWRAACNTLARRLSHGGGHTGWSRAWLVGLYARMRMPMEVRENVAALLRDSTLPNMLDSHPPFQIDGNFGGAAGVLEGLVTSHEWVRVAQGTGDWVGQTERGWERSYVTVIRLLPACPVEWRSGRLKGVVARGGFALDFDWADGEIVGDVIVRSLLGKSAHVHFHGAGSSAQEEAYRVVTINGKGEHRLPPTSKPS